MDTIRDILAGAHAHVGQRTQTGPTNSLPSSPDTLHEEQDSVPYDDLIAQLDNDNEELIREINRQRDHIPSIQEDTENINRQLDTERAANRELRTELEQVREQLRTSTERSHQLSDALSGSIRTRDLLRDMLNKAENLAPKFDSNLQQQQEIQSLQKVNKSLRTDNENLRWALKNPADVGEGHASGVRELRQQMAAIAAERDEARRKLQEMTEGYNANLEILQEEMTTSANLTEENQTIRTELDKAREELEEMTEGYFAMREGVEEAKSKSDELADENRTMRAVFREERTRSRNLSAENETMRVRLDEARAAARAIEENFRTANGNSVCFSQDCMQERQELRRLRDEFQDQEAEIQRLSGDREYLDRMYERRLGIAQDLAEQGVQLRNLRAQVERVLAVLENRDAQMEGTICTDRCHQARCEREREESNVSRARCDS